MRQIMQAVSHATIHIPEHHARHHIDEGMVVYVGIGKEDSDRDEHFRKQQAQKLLRLPLFADEQGKLTCSVQERGGGIMLVSNFTLYGIPEGNRVDFGQAAPFATAQSQFEAYLQVLQAMHTPVVSGMFGAFMEITSTAIGPVNYMLER